MYEPGEVFKNSMVTRAEGLLEYNAIKTIPTFTYEKSKFTDLWNIVISNIPEEDFNTWIGFYQAMDFCRNNRSITMNMTDYCINEKQISTNTERE